MSPENTYVLTEFLKAINVFTAAVVLVMLIIWALT